MVYLHEQHCSLSTVMGAPTVRPGGPPRTLVGALVTAALLVTTLFASTAPTAVLVGLLTPTATGLAAGFVVGVRSSRRSAVQLCLARRRRRRSAIF
ncbi:hypothetical protein [Halolamina sp.]|jgi:hypothetical protein|uniref:hypothetical protein n=1 Tax=Halolamina sp. TaxID=1940283 RepID=UPI000223B526|nr:hypothetical protein Halar_1035 [halophilic archaeon DL31]